MATLMIQRVSALKNSGPKNVCLGFKSTRRFVAPKTVGIKLNETSSSSILGPYPLHSPAFVDTVIDSFLNSLREKVVQTCACSEAAAIAIRRGSETAHCRHHIATMSCIQTRNSRSVEMDAVLASQIRHNRSISHRKLAQ